MNDFQIYNINDKNNNKNLTITSSNGIIKSKEKIRGELQMILRIIRAESLAGVHTHTHTHTHTINLINRVNIYKRKGNISLFGNYNDTG